MDFEFGMNFAEKQIINEKIKGKKINYYLQNKVRELTTFNKNWIESPLPNQSYSEVTGGVRNPEIFGNNITCSDKVKFHFSKITNSELLDKITEIISEIDWALNAPVSNNSIPRIKPVKNNNDSNQLYSYMNSAIQDKSEDINVKFVGINESNDSNELINLEQITFYHGRVKKDNAFNVKSVDELLEILQSSGYNLEDIKIKISNGDDNRKAVEIWGILDISLKFNNSTYIHTKHGWYYFNKTFIKLLDEQLREIEVENSHLNISENAMLNEDTFIDDVVNNNSEMVKLHKSFIRGNMSTKVELADLYDSNNKELFAVKMGLETPDTIYSLQQAILSLSMLNDRGSYDFSEIFGKMNTPNDLDGCDKYSILWPLPPRKTAQKYLYLYERDDLTLDKIGSVLIKLKISEWYNVSSAYGYKPKVYFIKE
ncbi:DUF6119 family protein [Staphylococcus simulans]